MYFIFNRKPSNESNVMAFKSYMKTYKHNESNEKIQNQGYISLKCIVDILNANMAFNDCEAIELLSGDENPIIMGTEDCKNEIILKERNKEEIRRVFNPLERTHYGLHENINGHLNHALNYKLEAIDREKLISFLKGNLNDFRFKEFVEVIAE